MHLSLFVLFLAAASGFTNPPPAGIPDFSAWTLEDGSVPFAYQKPQAAPGTAGEYLIARGLCVADETQCTFTISYAFFDEEAGKGRIIARIIARRDDGTKTFETFAILNRAEQKVRHFRPEKGKWVQVKEGSPEFVGDEHLTNAVWDINRHQHDKSPQ